MQNPQSSKREHRIHRHRRVRAKVKGTSKKPRLAVFRSNRGYFLQLIDDSKSKTIASVNSLKEKKELEKVKVDAKVAKEYNLKGKSLLGYQAGYLLAQRAAKAKVSTCVFDKAGFKFHGRVKAVADGARAGGLKF